MPVTREERAGRLEPAQTGTRGETGTPQPSLKLLVPFLFSCEKRRMIEQDRKHLRVVISLAIGELSKTLKARLLEKNITTRDQAKKESAEEIAGQIEQHFRLERKPWRPGHP